MKILTPRPLVRLLVLLAAELIFLISLSDSWAMIEITCLAELHVKTSLYVCWVNGILLICG
jgi:hypothetical protein